MNWFTKKFHSVKNSVKTFWPSSSSLTEQGSKESGLDLDREEEKETNTIEDTNEKKDLSLISTTISSTSSSSLGHSQQQQPLSELIAQLASPDESNPNCPSQELDPFLSVDDTVQTPSTSDSQQPPSLLDDLSPIAAAAEPPCFDPPITRVETPRWRSPTAFELSIALQADIGKLTRFVTMPDTLATRSALRGPLLWTSSPLHNDNHGHSQQLSSSSSSSTQQQAQIDWLHLFYFGRLDSSATTATTAIYEDVAYWKSIVLNELSCQSLVVHDIHWHSSATYGSQENENEEKQTTKWFVIELVCFQRLGSSVAATTTDVEQQQPHDSLLPTIPSVLDLGSQEIQNVQWWFCPHHRAECIRIATLLCQGEASPQEIVCCDQGGSHIVSQNWSHLTIRQLSALLQLLQCSGARHAQVRVRWMPLTAAAVVLNLTSTLSIHTGYQNNNTSNTSLVLSISSQWSEPLANASAVMKKFSSHGKEDSHPNTTPCVCVVCEAVQRLAKTTKTTTTNQETETQVLKSVLCAFGIFNGITPSLACVVPSAIQTLIQDTLVLDDVDDNKMKQSSFPSASTTVEETHMHCELQQQEEKEETDGDTIMEDAGVNVQQSHVSRQQPQMDQEPSTHSNHPSFTHLQTWTDSSAVQQPQQQHASETRKRKSSILGQLHEQQHQQQQHHASNRKRTRYIENENINEDDQRLLRMLKQEFG
jgi:hypothetical protein